MSYSQNDPRWRNEQLGFDTGPGETIGNYGCKVSSFADVLQWAGNDTNPSQLNQIMKNNGWFVNSDLADHDETPAWLVSALQYEGTTIWYDATPMEFFADASAPDVAYIVQIDASPQAGLQSHFVFVWATTGDGDLIIDDPWDGVRKNISAYGDPSTIIQRAIKYRIRPPQAPPVVIPDPVVPVPPPVIPEPPVIVEPLPEAPTPPAIPAPVEPPTVIPDENWIIKVIKAIIKWLQERGKKI